MKEYQFDCHDEGGSVQTSCVMHAQSDEDASDIARKLLLETECHAVEVRHKTMLIHRAVRGTQKQD